MVHDGDFSKAAEKIDDEGTPFYLLLYSARGTGWLSKACQLSADHIDCPAQRLDTPL